MAWLGLGLATPVFLYYSVIYVQSLAPSDPCATFDEIISRSANGYLINSHSEVCGTPAASATDSLQLLENAKDRPSTFFSYAGSAPYIRWITSRSLLITIFQVDEIYQESSQIGDVQVRYDFGTNYERGQDLYSECNPPNGPAQQRCVDFVAAMGLDCGLQGVTIQTYVDEVRLWIRTHPKEISRSASDIVKHPINEAGLCPRFPGA